MSEDDVDAWAKIDVGFFSHPKAREAGKNGRELYLASVLYSARHLTDGRIPESAVKLLAFEAEVPASTVNRLVAVGLWNHDGDGAYVIHDYLEHNRSRADAANRSAAGKAGANARWNANRIAEGNAERGEKIRHSRGDAAPYEAEFNDLWVNYPRKVNRKGALKAYQARRRAGVSLSMLATAVDHYAIEASGKDPSYVMHGATFFGPNERYRDFLEAPASNGADAGLDRAR